MPSWQRRLEVEVEVEVEVEEIVLSQQMFVNAIFPGYSIGHLEGRYDMEALPIFKSQFSSYSILWPID